MTGYLFDNCLSSKIARALSDLGHPVQHISAVFGSDAKDRHWIPKLRELDLSLVTVDLAISKKAAERIPLQKAGVTAIFFHREIYELGAEDQYHWFMKRWKITCNFIEQHPVGTHFLARTSGHITILEKRAFDEEVS